MVKNKVVAIVLLTLFCAVLLLPTSAYADMGPKPSVQVTFENMGSELCYATLLSKEPSTGPFSVWDGNEEHIDMYGSDEKIWRAFVEYNDSDGYYFLQWVQQCNETKKIAWTYYPPQKFKILLYYPDSGAFVSSEICEGYAFDSYFSVNMEGINIGSTQRTLSVDKNYDYGGEILALAVRIVITVLIEIGFALLFRLREKKVFLTVLFTNVITQILLNVSLNLIDFFLGSLSLYFLFFLLEFAVFVLEFVVYVLVFAKVSETKIPVWKTLLYTFVSNAVSCGIGFVAALLFPAIV